MKILVLGGAGYIGSHMIKLLFENGFEVTTFDNLSTGHREAVKWGMFVKGDLMDQKALEALFKSNKFDAVMHFAASALVGESMTNPALYYMNNVVGTFNLLEEMRKNGVDNLIFSSSCAVYGIPINARINEDHPMIPINPYGRTKLMVEQMLFDYASSYGIHSVSLRYFNAAGADEEHQIGESHFPETHLIPNVLKVALGENKNLKVFGNNYDTHDGTCVRDYIHVHDICRAHLQALKFMQSNTGAHVFNLGNGKGFSVLEILKAAEMVSENKIQFEFADCRPGDPSSLVADFAQARNKLGWKPNYTELEEIINTAWKWHQNQQF